MTGDVRSGDGSSALGEISGAAPPIPPQCAEMHFYVRDPRGKDLLETTSDNRGSGRRTSRRRRAEPALVSGTSGEFLGRKPLPRSVATRPALFIFGPAGVGKTSVARH